MHNHQENYNSATGEGCDVSNSNPFYHWGALVSTNSNPFENSDQLPGMNVSQA